MVADQRKKRVNAGSLTGCTSREQYRVKRKKLEFPPQDLNMRPNISLEWDKKKKCVVSKKEQVGISRRHLLPFVEAGPRADNILADVFSVPQEIYDLKNLSDVLTYEVWDSHLSENERSFLAQFLPKEAETDKVVWDLLAGDNFHFGNPSSTWGASLCLGELHPDGVIQKEESLRACKKAYYSDLQKYHMSMIKILQTWKEKWASCQDPELDVAHHIWRSRKHGEKKKPTSETMFNEAEENLVATPESCSLANSEKAYSGDTQNFAFMPVESQRRKGFSNKAYDDSPGEQQVVAMARKGEKLHRRNIQRGDGAKYMSYIKVSKEQHERIKSSMKHAGASIQPRSLNNVLGSIDALNVQPFERFEEEERKKLRAYWLQLANKDIAEGFDYWRKRRLLRQQLTQSLAEEVGQKKMEQEEVNVEEEKVDSGKLTEISDDSEDENCHAITTEVEEKEPSDGLPNEPADNEEEIRERVAEIEDEMDGKADYTFEEKTPDDTEIEDEGPPGSVMIQDCNQQQIASISDGPRVEMMVEPPNPVFLEDQHQEHHITSVNCNPQIDSMEMGSQSSGQDTKGDDDPPLISGYTGNVNHVGIHVSQGGDPLPPASSDVWSAGDIHGSYYQSNAANDGYASTQELSLGHQQFMQQEQPVQILDLGTDRHDKRGSTKNMLQRQSDDISFFSSYSNQDRSELLQSFFKGQSSLAYSSNHHEQKHTGFEFQHENDLMIEAGQFPRHMREHTSVPVDLRHKRLNEHHLYMHQNIQESMYPDGSRYAAMTRQEQLPVDIHDWASVDTARLPAAAAAAQPNLNVVELSPNWYAAGGNGVRDGWSNFEDSAAVNHNLNRGSNSDETLFSVVSECNELRPSAAAGSYDSIGPISTERFVQAGNYGGGIPASSSSSGNMLQHQSSNPLNYLSGHEAAPGGDIKMNSLGIGWMGMPQQQNTRPIQESMAKPFLRSWNQ